MIDRTFSREAGMERLAENDLIVRLCLNVQIEAGHSFHQTILETNEGKIPETFSSAALEGYEWECEQLRNVERSVKASRCRHQTAERAADMLSEVIGNAAEHGSSLGQRGNVIIEAHSSRNGFFAVVTDPGKGFDLRTLPRSENSSRVLPDNEAEGRGNGGKVLASSECQVYFKKQRNQFISLLYVPN